MSCQNRLWFDNHISIALGFGFLMAFNPDGTHAKAWVFDLNAGNFDIGGIARDRQLAVWENLVFANNRLPDTDAVIICA